MKAIAKPEPAADTLANRIRGVQGSVQLIVVAVSTGAMLNNCVWKGTAGGMALGIAEQGTCPSSPTPASALTPRFPLDIPSGWRRMCLLVLYFNPSNLLEPDASFEALSDRLICPPVVQTLVYSKFRGAVSAEEG